MESNVVVGSQGALLPQQGLSLLSRIEDRSLVRPSCPGMPARGA